MAQRSVPAPFLTKTYQFVDDQETNDVVSWNDNGTAFVVWKTADFARDLLPKYFKHNNFSSFVRQLNTYGFRKVVPDKWEFANDNFRRAQKQLLSDIRRRKATTSPAAQADKRHPEISATPSVSAGDDLGSTSTSLQPDPKSSAGSAPAQVADLSGENEKLKKDNAVLSTELAQTKRQCDELIAFLTKYVNVGPDQIDRIMKEGTVVIKGHDDDDDDDDDDDEKVDDEENEGVKLFGVWVINRKRKKMDGCDGKGYSGGPRGKEMKGVDFHAPPLMVKIGGEVCN